MYKLLILILFLGTHLFSTSQSRKIVQEVTQFSIESSTDTIEFIIPDTLLTEQKPVFLWCQGSLPTPLFAEIENYGPYLLGGGIVNFDYKALAEKYHLVVISMPKTPVVALKENLNPQYQYVPDASAPQQFSTAYLEANYLENYVNRAQAVLDFLAKQTWVDNTKLIVAGHSQGTKVATKIARKNKNVTHLGLFAANPFGRVDQFIREARLDAQLGKISWQEADSIMNANYSFFEEAHQQKSDANAKTWTSFSETFYDDWLELDIPIYLAYGTEDRIADLCDIVPLFFIQANKKNLTLKRYLGLNHNFFELNENGRPDRKKGHWKEVMLEFVESVEN